ncbi:MAG: hypothetical protein U0414_16365 [Polyangiaceae bacterium]
MTDLRPLDSSSRLHPFSTSRPRRPWGPLAGALAAIATLLAISTAEAAGKKDKEALALADAAINEDYIGANIPAAEEKLAKAIKLCGADQCSGEALGKIYMSRAAVVGLGKSDMASAKQDLVQAYKADPNVKPIEGLTSPEFEKAMKEAKAEAGTGSSGSGGSQGTGGSGGGTAPAGDFDHTPLEEGQVSTPFPIIAEIPDEIGATKVIARYKGFGGTSWKTLTLDKIDGGWGGMVDCKDITSVGDLRYYIVASDDSGTPVATAGSLKEPFKVPLKAKLKGPPPSLPGKPPPQKCAGVNEVPTDLVGRGDKVEGVSCNATQECMEGLLCSNGVCEKDPDYKQPSNSGKKNLITVSAQFDIAALSSHEGKPVCGGNKEEINDSLANYACFVETTGKGFSLDANNDTDGDGKPDAKAGNSITGGLGFSHVRLFAGYDRILPLGFSLGARIGYTFLGYGDTETAPKGRRQLQFLPVHFEARAGWMLAKDGVKKGMIFPHAFIGGGVGENTPYLPVAVNCTNPVDGSKCDPNNPGKILVDAYELSGQGFVDFGGGATYMIVDNFGVQAEVKFSIWLPTIGFTFSPVIAPVIAF